MGDRLCFAVALARQGLPAMRWLACLALILVVHGANREQPLEGDVVELSRSSANALDDDAIGLIQTRSEAKATFPSLVGGMGLSPKLGHHRLADENAEDAALAKANEVGQKLETKATKWTS